MNWAQSFELGEIVVRDKGSHLIVLLSVIRVLAPLKSESSPKYKDFSIENSNFENLTQLQ